MSGRVSVILSTFNQPRPLALALRGYGRQTHSDFEVIVADDGSGPETAHVVQRAREQGLNVRHTWQDDRGFRKTEALNRAIGVARGAYLIFSDGDCIPRDDFVATHARLAEPDRFLSGGYLKLPESVTRAVDERAIDAEDVFDSVWLRSRGFSSFSETTWWILKILDVLETETKSPETFFDLSDFGRRNPSVHLIKVRRFSKKSKDWWLSSKMLQGQGMPETI